MKLQKIIVILVLSCCLLPIKTIFADTAAPPKNASPEELANYYQALAQKYENLAKQYQIQAGLNKTNKKPAIPTRTTSTNKINKIAQEFDGTYAGLGLVQNTGNVNSYNLYTKAFVQYQPSKTKITTLTSTYQNAYEQGKGQLNDNFFIDLNSINNFDENQGMYVDANYNRDTFSGYDYIANESIGYNRVLYQGTKLSLNGQIGPGLNQQKIENETTTNQLSAYIKLNTSYAINEQNNWQEIFTTTATPINTIYTLDSNITTNIWNQFALQFDFYMSQDTHPAPDKYSFNTTTTISLLYNF